MSRRGAPLLATILNHNFAVRTERRKEGNVWYNIAIRVVEL